MSKHDGQMRRENLYCTSDSAFAAYLMLRGFELLGAIDDGSPRQSYGLTSMDPERLVNMAMTVDAMFDEFENQYASYPHDPGSQLNFREYFRNIKKLHDARDQPIKEPIA